jgi:hypothetical protein
MPLQRAALGLAATPQVIPAELAEVILVWAGPQGFENLACRTSVPFPERLVRLPYFSAVIELSLSSFCLGARVLGPTLSEQMGRFQPPLIRLLDREQEDGRCRGDGQKSKQCGLSGRASPKFFPATCRSGSGRLSGQVAVEVLRQLQGTGIAASWLLFQAFQNDCLECWR